MTTRTCLAPCGFCLKPTDFDVRTFKNGAALLRAVRSTGVDCFVIDYKMPDMNGVELAGRLRNRDIAAPVILITGYPDDNISARAAAAGIRHVLLKPHLEESLVTRIRGAIEEGPRQPTSAPAPVEIGTGAL